jgi:hypothetical protein
MELSPIVPSFALNRARIFIDFKTQEVKYTIIVMYSYLSLIGSIIQSFLKTFLSSDRQFEVRELGSSVSNTDSIG